MPLFTFSTISFSTALRDPGKLRARTPACEDGSRQGHRCGGDKDSLLVGHGGKSLSVISYRLLIGLSAIRISFPVTGHSSLATDLKGFSLPNCRRDRVLS